MCIIYCGIKFVNENYHVLKMMVKKKLIVYYYRLKTFLGKNIILKIKKNKTKLLS